MAPTPTTPTPVTAASSPSTTVAPTTAARVQPTAAQVQAAIDGLLQYSPLTPSAAQVAQVAQVGDTVCSAFDKGDTYAQVVATAQGWCRRSPVVSDVNGAATYAVHEAVALYCPGYSSKLP